MNARSLGTNDIAALRKPPIHPLGSSTALLLNLAHAIDHWFLLIFATAVLSMSHEFGFARWEDLMPYGTGAFFLFGLGSVLAGKLGDQWGRRRMMLIYFFGMGLSMLVVATSVGPWSLAWSLTLMGAFASIYHPVGIPMLLKDVTQPGRVIGVNGLSGNLGIAGAALLTGFLVKYLGWRWAFIAPGLVCILLGWTFHRVAPQEIAAPSKQTAKKSLNIPAQVMAQVFLIMTLAAVSASLIFNFTTNGNTALLQTKLGEWGRDPARLGLLMAVVYALASLAQLVVGRLIDKFPLKTVWLSVVSLQIPLFALAAWADGWWFYALQVLFMAAVFGSIPFTDAVIVRYVDDRMRSRVSGMRLTLSYTASSLAVWALGPLVKASGFSTLLVGMAVTACITLLVVSRLPQTPQP
jgi:MFS family permease